MTTGQAILRTDQVGTYWYPTHQPSHIGVRSGLYGILVVKPRAVLIGDRDGCGPFGDAHTSHR
jgi:FtsP/CotA-like multicopper oxidase with cupredoxin domain